MAGQVSYLFVQIAIVRLSSFVPICAERKKSMNFWRKESVECSCPHCGFKTIVNNELVLQLFYCKHCKEVQTQPTKKVVEIVVEKENRGFWQWLFHKPAATKRSIHADMVPCSPQCYKCKRTDMMVPFDQEHCPICGNLLERHDNLFN